MTKLPWALLALTEGVELAFDSALMTGVLLTTTIVFGAIATLNTINQA